VTEPLPFPLASPLFPLASLEGADEGVTPHLLFCSCGRAMIGHSAKSHNYFYYTCSRGFKQGEEAVVPGHCPRKNWSVWSWGYSR